MLSVYPSEIQQHYHQQALPPVSFYYTPLVRPMPHRQPELPAGSVLGFGNMTTASHHHKASNGSHHHHHQQEAAVVQALEIARESPDGASDPTVSKILEHALSQIWARVQAQPESYVMSRDEFAVFNFFQHRFTGDKTAIKARKRYWDHARA